MSRGSSDDSFGALAVVLLYGRKPPEIGFSVERLMAERGFDCVGDDIYSDGMTHVALRSVTAPAAADQFHAALACATDREALEALIQRHETHITIRVAGDRRPLLERLALLHALARAIARTATPMALFWAPSAQILSGPQYSALHGVDRPWALFLRPVLSAEGKDADGRPLTRLTLDRADEIFGRAVGMAPSPLPRPEMLRHAIAFVQYCHENNVLPPDGSLIPSGKTIQLQVCHHEGGIELTAHDQQRGLPPGPGTRTTDTVKPAKWRAALAATGIVGAIALSLGLSAQLMTPKQQAFAVAEIEVQVLPPIN